MIKLGVIPILGARGENHDRAAGGFDAFEQTIGPVAAIEPEWYRHVQTIKAALNGKVRNFYKTGQLPPDQ